jgi:signal transduction histidine kinase
VHRIVNDYGGEIQVTSNVGAGTTVEIRLPARSALEA